MPLNSVGILAIILYRITKLLDAWTDRSDCQFLNPFIKERKIKNC